MRFPSSIVLLAFATFGQSSEPAQTNISSTLLQGVDISYKYVPAQICGTTGSYAGYVDFSPNTMTGVGHDYPIHTFFWFFPAQKNPDDAPLVVWLSGGPGASSIFALFTENGPCHFEPNATAPESNPWSWNLEYNLLYVDQPVQTGFSYDIATDGLLDLETGNIIPGNSPATNTTIRGVFASQDVKQTANTTENAARQFWNFLEVWTQDFGPFDAKNAPMALWTESYGGRYGPSFAAFIVEQNALLERGALASATHLNLETLGIINGCVDLPVQESYAPRFGYNENPYSIEGINSTEHSAALAAYPECIENTKKCLELAADGDPEMYGANSTVNEACEHASFFCQEKVEGPYLDAQRRGFYDITHCYLDAFPGNEFLEYLADEKVLEALGVRVNYTDLSNSVGLAFNLTGDYARRNPGGGYLGDLATLLDSGIQVAMVYGDRDFACNWLGGEQVSLNVSYDKATEFRAAGYANITIDSSPLPVGQVRQHGLFSFTRVYQSGHMVPAYQPEVALRILERTMQKKDVATGTTDADSDFSTSGLPHSSTTLKAPPVPPVTCYLRALPITCAKNQIQAVENGSAKIVNGIVVDPAAPEDTCPKNPTGSVAESPGFIKQDTSRWEWEQADL